MVGWILSYDLISLDPLSLSLLNRRESSCHGSVNLLTALLWGLTRCVIPEQV